MKIRAIRASFVIGMLAVVSCTLGANDESLSDENTGGLGEDGALGTIRDGLAKGKVGAVNGAADYCGSTVASLCASGEGDCDANSQCAAGLICTPDNGPRFGFPTGWDVCTPAHCSNKAMDGDETGIDCGGSCGACSACVGTPGSANFCLGCQCASGQGDCDSAAECASGLNCGTDNGPLFGLPVGYDVCVPPHCTNHVLDAASGETGIDEGGACGTRAATCSGTPGSANFCVGCQCNTGQGDCDSDAECASGLVCATNNGSKFGLPSSYDVCVPSHCTNHVLDASSGETSIDAGGECGIGPSVCGNGVVEAGEVCDDGVNDGVVCSSDCLSAPSVGVIRWDCDGGSGVITSLAGTGCISFPGQGASYLSLSAAVNVTLYSNGDCTGNSTVASSDLNFCGASFDQGGGLNDAVNSAKISH